MSNCKLCGDPMPEGEEMFEFHGYSGPCEKPPLPGLEAAGEISDARLRELWKECGGAWNKQRLQFFVERDLLPSVLRGVIAKAIIASSGPNIAPRTDSK